MKIFHETQKLSDFKKVKFSIRNLVYITKNNNYLTVSQAKLCMASEDLETLKS